MTDELARAVFPRTIERKFTTRITRKLQSFDAGAAEVFVQNTDRPITDYVFRTGNREGGDRNAACQRFELHDTESVGPARKNKNIGRRQVRGKSAVLQRAEKLGIGKFALAPAPPVPQLAPSYAVNMPSAPTPALI